MVDIVIMMCCSERPAAETSDKVCHASTDDAPMVDETMSLQHRAMETTVSDVLSQDAVNLSLRDAADVSQADPAAEPFVDYTSSHDQVSISSREQGNEPVVAAVEPSVDCAAKTIDKASAADGDSDDSTVNETVDDALLEQPATELNVDISSSTQDPVDISSQDPATQSTRDNLSSEDRSDEPTVDALSSQMVQTVDCAVDAASGQKTAQSADQMQTDALMNDETETAAQMTNSDVQSACSRADERQTWYYADIKQQWRKFNIDLMPKVATHDSPVICSVFLKSLLLNFSPVCLSFSFHSVVSHCWLGNSCKKAAV